MPQIEPVRPAPICECDLTTLKGLAAAIEVCSDVMSGLMDEQTARRALPALVKLHSEELDRLSEHAHESTRRDVQ